jgi:hypothetical protein
MIAMERRRVETTVRLDRPAILAEFDDIFRHDRLRSWRPGEDRPIRCAAS